ncbi:hypothetical protein [Amycolatopsis sp. lyj-346]|uniref:hypothetical protein n=1 Tax=Amycolatopsis sp. lyj-346 TaxID=2789289 RepID=UPI00397AAB94
MSRPLAVSAEARQARGRLAASTRDHGPDHPITCAARREFRSEKYLASVRAVVDAAPPIDQLKPEQRDRLASLLRPVVRAAEGGAA